jgi:pimeloyl-ACP methyl ester carboxylesterase
MQSNFIHVNGIRLHYLDYGSPSADAPFAVLMHGLTANAHAFDGLIQSGLTRNLHGVSVDLRGRGESDKPDTGYSMSDHARDIIGLLDTLQIDKAILIGHSFGGLLSMCLASQYPSRVIKVVLLDAAMRMHPNTRAMLSPSLSRLGQTWLSFDDYLAKIKAAPYLVGAWSDAMLSYYRADVMMAMEGSVTTRSGVLHIGKCLEAALNEPYEHYARNTYAPTLLLNATAEYALGAPLLPPENAVATAKIMPNCTVQSVRGNHQTMLYGEGAVDIVNAIHAFV